MTEGNNASNEIKKAYDETSTFAKYGIRSLTKAKNDKRKVTKESVAFCCSKSSLDERDINQCTQCVV